jgi:hypothetical protein
MSKKREIFNVLNIAGLYGLLREQFDFLTF